MELLVLNTDFQIIAILDTFESFIWTDRYCGYGDFELYGIASDELLNILKEDYYIMLSDSSNISIIEDRKIKDVPENGDHIIITGRSGESIIDRRILLDQIVLTGSLQNGIKKLLDENIISPTITDRQIPNFIFEESTDPIILALTVDIQYIRGTNIYTIINDLCSLNNIGFKVTLSDSNKFVFSLYSGIDRSYNQIENPYVIFSKKFDNILSTSYLRSKKLYKTLTLVEGEGDETTSKTAIVGGGVALSRREIYTDAKSLSQTVDGVLITDEAYNLQMTQAGLDNLAKNKVKEVFDGDVDTTTIFKYGEDFGMGDIVQLVGDYGIEGRARVTELIRSQSDKGVNIYPEFTIIQ